jgi:hypothetical protein
MDDGESEYHAVEAVFYRLTTGEPVYVFYTYRYKALETGTMWEYIQCREKPIAWGSTCSLSSVVCVVLSVYRALLMMTNSLVQASEGSCAKV